MDEVLVHLPSAAGVLRLDDGSALLTADVARCDGWSLQGTRRLRPAVVSTDRDTSVVGGLLPPGAVVAEVVNDRGSRVAAEVANGAYVIELDQRYEGAEPIVCCRDADGVPVPRPRAADDPSVPVTDASDSCPACEAVDFEEYLPSEAPISGALGPDGEIVPRPIVRCRVCGHEQDEPVVLRAPGRPTSPEPVPSREQLMAKADAMRRESMWRSVADGVVNQGFAIYVAAGWSARIVQSRSEDDGRLTSVTVAHARGEDGPDSRAYRQPQLTVATERDDPSATDRVDRARLALRRWARSDERTDRPARSEAATTLRHRAHSRRNLANALNAAESDQSIEIDGQTVPALMLTAATGGWAAVARHSDLTITIAGHDLDPSSLSFSPVPDPATSFGAPVTNI